MTGLNGFLNGETEYAIVAASQTAGILGATGSVGDYLSHLVIIPATAAPGTVALLDGATTLFTITPPASTQPFTVAVGATSKVGAWKLTTGANVSVMSVGDFT
jgi:hypothetical protein